MLYSWVMSYKEDNRQKLLESIQEMVLDDDMTSALPGVVFERR